MKIVRLNESDIITMISESLNRLITESNLRNIDLCDVGMVECESNLDEDSYVEWLEENDLENNQENLKRYFIEEVDYTVTYYDNQTYHYMASDNILLYDDLEEMFGSDMSNKILNGCIKNGEYSFETVELYWNQNIDINNPDEINDIAIKMFSHGGYFKNCRGFILTNGVIVYTEGEHNEILSIPGIDSKFQFIELGNIRIMPNSIDIGCEPTYEQEKILRRVISSYSDEELYVDMLYHGNYIGVKYVNPDYHYVLGEIDRLYNEGIKPRGRD